MTHHLTDSDRKLAKILRIDVGTEPIVTDPDLATSEDIAALLCNDQFLHDISRPVCADCAELAGVVSDYECAEIMYRETVSCLMSDRDRLLRRNASLRWALCAAAVVIAVLVACVVSL